MFTSLLPLSFFRLLVHLLCFSLADFRCFHISLLLPYIFSSSLPQTIFYLKNFEQLLCFSLPASVNVVSTTTKRRWRRSQMSERDGEKKLNDKKQKVKLVFFLAVSKGAERARGRRVSIQIVSGETSSSLCFFASASDDEGTKLQDVRHEGIERSTHTPSSHHIVCSLSPSHSLLEFFLFPSSCSRRRHKKFYTCTAERQQQQRRWQAKSVDTKNKLIQFLCVFSRISNSDMSFLPAEENSGWHPKTFAYYVRYTLLLCVFTLSLSAAAKPAGRVKKNWKKYKIK